MNAIVSKRRPGWWYPYIYVGVFGVVLAVNLVFMSSAISTFTGLETEHAYEKGLAYNQILAQAARQKLLGWQVDVQVVPRDGNTDKVHDADVIVSFKDKDGKGVTGLSAKMDFIRPTKDGFDRQIELMEQGEGRYVALAKLPLAGQWDTRLLAKKGETDYQLSQRILVP